MMKEIFNQAGSAGIEVAFIQFVGTSGTMDGISASAGAKLYTLGTDHTLSESEEAPWSRSTRPRRSMIASWPN